MTIENRDDSAEQVDKEEYASLEESLIDSHISPLVAELIETFRSSIDPESQEGKFFFNGGNRYQGFIEQGVVDFITIIREHFPTPEKLKSLLRNGDVELIFFRITIQHAIERRIGKALSMFESGYDNLMKGFINYRSRGGKMVFDKVTSTLLEEGKLERIPLCTIFIDLDNFKGINDYGHFVGDEALKHLAQVIKKELRDDTLCVRWGGEEIVIILDGATLQDTVQAAKRIKDGLANNPLYLVADIESADAQKVSNALPIEKTRYVKLIHGYEHTSIQRRGKETTIPDPRNRTGANAIRLIEIPLSASIGISPINPHEDDAIIQSVQAANHQEMSAKKHGRNQIWAHSEQVG